MRKIWTIIGVLVLGGGIIFLGYYLRPKNKAPFTYLDNTPSLPNAGGGASSTLGTAGFKPIFKEGVLGYSAGSNVMAVDMTGKIIETDGKNESVLSSSTLTDAFFADTSYDGQFMLIGFGDNQNEQYRIWNAKSGLWRFLPAGATSPSFSPSAHQVAYLINVAQGTQLWVLNLDTATSRGTLTVTLPLIDISANWISQDKVEIKEKGALLSPSSDFMFSLSHKTIMPTVIEKNGLDILWNPSGKMGLALLGQARGGNMFLIDGSGEILQTMSLLTLPEKCAWSGEGLLFCAIPQDANNIKTALPDAFYKNLFFSNDNFYEINTITGDITPVLENKNGLDAVNMTVNGSNLYFINRLDQKLYSLPIPK